MTPSAAGTLADTPLAHALIYARNRRLTGRLELSTTDDRSAAITLWGGRIVAVETTPLGMCPGGFFGGIAYELGFITSPALDKSLLEIAKSRRLHGEVLIEQKAITVAQRDETLVEQVHRKVQHLFTLPETTRYAFYDARVVAAEPPVAVDPLGPVWRGIRDYPPTKFVSQTMRRIGSHALRATTGGSARLPPAETALTQALAARPMTLDEMKASTELPPARVELLVYLLVIAKAVEAVSGVRTHPSTGALPSNMPSGPLHGVSGETRRLSRPITAPPTSTGPKLPGSPSSSKVAAQRSSSSKVPIVAAPRPLAGTLAALQSPSDLGIDGIIARAEAVQDESYFEVLGVAEGASAEAVRAAFMRLAKTWHPDRLLTDFLPARDEVAKIFAHMATAQKTLCDDGARRAYLDGRKQKAARPRVDVLREIELALSKRDFDGVVRMAQTLIDSDGDDAEAIAIQAWAAVRNGDATDDELRAAVAKIERAVNVDRTCSQAVYLRGVAHRRLGNLPAAFRDFARALQLNPKHVEAEREVRIIAMRARKGSGEQTLAQPLRDKATAKK